MPIVEYSAYSTSRIVYQSNPLYSCLCQREISTKVILLSYGLVQSFKCFLRHIRNRLKAGVIRVRSFFVPWGCGR